MDPIANLGRNAYHALCLAFAAQNKDKLYAPVSCQSRMIRARCLRLALLECQHEPSTWCNAQETDVLLEEARELLGISEEDDEVSAGPARALLLGAAGKRMHPPSALCRGVLGACPQGGACGCTHCSWGCGGHTGRCHYTCHRTAAHRDRLMSTPADNPGAD